MSEIPLEQIAEAIQSLRRYHFRVECTPGIIFEGEMDLAEGRQHIQIGLLPGTFPLAEVFWDGETGYGRRLQSDLWLRLRGKPFPNYLRFALRLLQEAKIVSAREEGPFWLVDIQPDCLPPRDDPEEFYRDIFGEPKDLKEREFLERVIELSRSLEMSLQMRISREDYLICGVIARSQAKEVRSELTAAFSPIQIDVPQLPDEAPQLADPEVQVPVSMLLLDLPEIGGWSPEQRNHGPWAQRSIQLIKENEAKLPAEERKYAEIYHQIWFKEPYTQQVAITREKAKLEKADHTKHHPLVLGAIYEDCTSWKDKKGVEKGMPDFYDNWFASDDNYKKNPNYYFSQKPYWRDYHHYGGEDVGLQFAWYFWFRGYPPTTKPGDRYYSARDWGFGGGRIAPPDLNRLTFTQAIKQYNRYSEEGKRNAYLMLGHVLHLLQDVGQPDHAKLEAHAGSGMNEKEAYDRYHYCEFLAAEAAGFADPKTFLIVLSSCKKSAKESEMGYEKLVAEYCLDECGLSQVENQIKTTGTLTQPNYDAYFKNMSKFAIGASNQLSMDSPLGCGWLKLIPPIPGADPDIESTNPGQRQPYVDLTKKVVPQIIGLSAGLIKHFYEIVNYPPYVERVAIVQWEPGAKPVEFASFQKKKNKMPYCVRYNAEWVMSKNKRTLKHYSPTKPQPLSLDRPAYIFILFGPTKIRPEKGGRIMSQAKLRLVGTYPVDGKPIDVDVKLEPAYDNNVGQYYWGTFGPRNCGPDDYTLTLIIEGKDNAAHLAQRQPSGDEIDGDPATIALVDESLPPKYPWKDYEPGPDMNHKIKIAPAEWKLVINPQGVLPIGPSRRAKGEVTLQIKQKAWDCGWEWYWGPLRCPVEWELLPRVTRLGTPPQTGSWEDFGFEVRLIVHRSGDAKLVIAPDWRRYRPGTYEIKVWYQVGEPQYIWSGIAVIVVELL